MTIVQRINQFFMNIEWRTSLILTVVGGMGSFALPAWAVRATEWFGAFAPASWVGAGFAGLLLFAFSYALTGWGRQKWIRSTYDKKMISRGSYVDPMAKTFEDKRIYLNEFCLPSHPVIENKTFINCEIIGPANILLDYGNSVQEARNPINDAVRLKHGANMYNAMFVRRCLFRQCSFQRVTFLVTEDEYRLASSWLGFNWIADGTLPAEDEGNPPLPPPDTEA